MEKKKIKVVSMYPNTPFKIGDILEYRNIYGPEYVSPRTGNTIGIVVVEEHPNIFKDVNNRGLVEIIKRILRINFFK